MRKDTKIISKIGSFFKKTAENKAINDIMAVISTIRLQERQIGISKKQREKRYSKMRTSDTAVSDRIAEYSESKLESLKKHIKEAVRRKVKFEYLLVDSWFTCKDLIEFVLRECPKAHLLGMIKMGKTKYTTESRNCSLLTWMISSLQLSRIIRKQPCF